MCFEYMSNEIDTLKLMSRKSKSNNFKVYNSLTINERKDTSGSATAGVDSI